MEMQIQYGDPVIKYVRNTSILILVFLGVISLVLIYNFIRKTKNNPISIKERYQSAMLIIFLTIGIFICIAEIYYPAKYIIDYNNDDTVVVYENIEEIQVIERSTRIIHTKYDEYRLVAISYSLQEFNILCDDIKDNYIGKYCEIEYYKTSRYIKSIKIFGDE